MENYNQNREPAELVAELFDGYDKGDFNDLSTVSVKYTYRYLKAIWDLRMVLEGGEELYKQVYRMAIQCGLQNVKKKYAMGEKIKIAFLAISATEWPAESVYRILEKIDWVQQYIVVCPLVDRTRENMLDAYNKTLAYFENGNYCVRPAYDAENDRVLLWKEIGEPDIVIHLNNWYQSVPQEYWIENIPFTWLNCYIPYSMGLADNAQGTYVVNITYNKQFLNMMWRVYADTKYNYCGYKEYELLNGENVCYSGFPKMDYFYEKRKFSESDIKKIWKIPDEKSAGEMKKVIIAPHHSFKGHGGILYSTFQWNMYFWIYLIQKYKDTVTFILKPHPHLRARGIEAGVFKDGKDFEDYVNLWNSFPNAKVVQEESYLEIFATSDGMIMDSCSFLAEYMYTNKPLLFLRREEQCFNGLGKMAIEAYEQVNGKSFLEIEKFLKRAIIDGEDLYREKRKKIFEKELNYFEDNKKLAGDMIVEDILSQLEIEGDQLLKDTILNV